MNTMTSSPPKLLILLRIGISLSLLTWALARVGFHDVWSHASGANLLLLAYAFILFNVGVLLRTVRWAILLRGYGLRLAYSSLLVLNYGGTFFNTFLPTGFGGDFVRMAESGGIWRERREVAAGIVLLDRFSGLSALFVLCFVALTLSGGLLPSAMFRTLLGVSILGMLMTVAVVASKSLFSLVLPLIRRVVGENRGQSLERVFCEFPLRHFFAAVLVSTGFHLLMVAVHFALSRALGSTIPVVLFGVFTPIVSLTLLLPSVQGLGLRENLYGFLVSGIGLPESLGVSIALLVYAVTLFTGLAGGLVYLIFGIHRAVRELPSKPEARLS